MKKAFFFSVAISVFLCVTAICASAAGTYSKTCPECSGTGQVTVYKQVYGTCSACNGWIYVRSDSSSKICFTCGSRNCRYVPGFNTGSVVGNAHYECNNCGSGEVYNGYKCTTCSGTGQSYNTVATKGTCSECYGSGSVTVYCYAHSYGSWRNINSTYHGRTCSICQQEAWNQHTWDAGVSIKKGTCKEEGEKTYTCTTCYATKTEKTAKSTTHTYDNTCDADCNICGKTREINHKYNAIWGMNGVNHWRECTVCKNKDMAAHTPGAEATETRAQTCTTCGYVIKVALGHKHKFAAAWSADAAGHWHMCSGCAEKSSYAAHDFETDCDKDCSICGYTREIEHKFAETWTTDATNHWRVCSGCGLKQEEAAHEPGAEATETTAQTCIVCGYEIAPVLDIESTPPAVTDPTETTQSATPVEQDSPDKPNVILWIVIAVVVVAGGVVAFVIIRKKKH